MNIKYEELPSYWKGFLKQKTVEEEEPVTINRKKRKIPPKPIEETDSDGNLNGFIDDSELETTHVEEEEPYNFESDTVFHELFANYVQLLKDEHILVQAKDVKLYISPSKVQYMDQLLLTQQTQECFNNCFEQRVLDHFAKAVEKIKRAKDITDPFEKDQELERVARYLIMPEIPFVLTGYVRNTVDELNSAGYGIGKSDAYNFAKRILLFFENYNGNYLPYTLFQMVADGIGADKIGDLMCNLLLFEICYFTDQIVAKLQSNGFLSFKELKFETIIQRIDDWNSTKSKVKVNEPLLPLVKEQERFNPSDLECKFKIPYFKKFLYFVIPTQFLSKMPSFFKSDFEKLIVEKTARKIEDTTAYAKRNLQFSLSDAIFRDRELIGSIYSKVQNFLRREYFSTILYSKEHHALIDSTLKADSSIILYQQDNGDILFQFKHFKTFYILVRAVDERDLLDEALEDVTLCNPIFLLFPGFGPQKYNANNIIYITSKQYESKTFDLSSVLDYKNIIEANLSSSVIQQNSLLQKEYPNILEKFNQNKLHIIEGQIKHFKSQIKAKQELSIQRQNLYDILNRIDFPHSNSKVFFAMPLQFNNPYYIGEESKLNRADFVILCNNFMYTISFLSFLLIIKQLIQHHTDQANSKVESSNLQNRNIIIHGTYVEQLGPNATVIGNQHNN